MTRWMPALILGLTAAPAWAQDGLNHGDTAWILTATALVLFMTIAVLLRPRAHQECVEHIDAVLHPHLHGLPAVGWWPPIAWPSARATP